MPVPQLPGKAGEHFPTLQPSHTKSCVSALQPSTWLALGTTKVTRSKTLSHL